MLTHLHNIESQITTMFTYPNFNNIMLMNAITFIKNYA